MSSPKCRKVERLQSYDCLLCSRLSYISVTGTDDNLYVGPFDSSAGTVTCYWKNANTSSSRRKAYVRFSGLDASAACTVYHEGKSTFIVNDDSDNGEADNTYD